ncbi:MAG: hypothetical protein QMC89_04625 [Candidatus Hodarchaeaceae archaeon]|nr:hypothetical protein [Candidatus Hodarchaeaceae archaeon]
MLSRFRSFITRRPYIRVAHPLSERFFDDIVALEGVERIVERRWKRPYPLLFLSSSPILHTFSSAEA